MLDRLRDLDVWDSTRMLFWLLLSVVCYVVALDVEPPQLQTLFWKIGHLNVAAHLGYWIARGTLGRLYSTSPPNDRIARALIIVGAMIAVSQGL